FSESGNVYPQRCRGSGFLLHAHGRTLPRRFTDPNPAVAAFSTGLSHLAPAAPLRPAAMPHPVSLAFACLAIATSSWAANAAQPAAPPASAPAKEPPYPLVMGPIRLYEGPAPGALGEGPQHIPTLTPFPADPAKRNG